MAKSLPSSPLLLTSHINGVTCDQTYGFLPCTTTVAGNMFLIFVYGYFIFLAAKYLAKGIYTLLENVGHGFLAAFLPLFNSLPGVFIILGSGLFGSKENGERKANIGMGYITGSTVTLMTLIWGTCILLGKCDLGIQLSNSNSIPLDSRGFCLTGSGVTTNEESSYNARIMVISVIPFLIVQISQLFSSTFLSHLAILISLITSMSLLLSYYLYQVWHPWTQKTRLDYARNMQAEHANSVMNQMKSRATERFLTQSGEVDIDAIEKTLVKNSGHRILAKVEDGVKSEKGTSVLKFFERIKNSEGYITAKELRAVICGLHFDDIDQKDISYVIKEFLAEFNAPFGSRINLDEFVAGISNWLRKPNRSQTIHGESSVPSAPGFKHSHPTKRILDQRRSLKMGALTVAATTRLMQTNRAQRDEIDEAAFSIEISKWITYKAILHLIMGSLIAAAFANPLVDVVDSFSKATTIPSILASFVILPLITSSEIISALFHASMKKKKIIASLTFSEIYGRVTTNNIVCLSIFLAIIFIKQLTWSFSSEVAIILIICVGMGLFASIRTTFPLWTCLVAYILYPFSLILVYVLTYVLGWS